MDIISNSKNEISRLLSNFAEHHFILDGVKIRSMESFLQSLKSRNNKDQEIICNWPGYKAKLFFKELKWYKLKDKDLYWKGKLYNRFRIEYQELLDKAYQAIYDQNEDFRNNLKLTKKEELTHKIGNSNSSFTILTEKEFINRLNKLRETGKLIKNKNKPLF
jgi:hypothetical protein